MNRVVKQHRPHVINKQRYQRTDFDFYSYTFCPLELWGIPIRFELVCIPGWWGGVKGAAQTGGKMAGGMSIWRQSLPGPERNLKIIILLSFRLDHSKQIQMRFLLENSFSLLFHLDHWLKWHFYKQIFWRDDASPSQFQYKSDLLTPWSAVCIYNTLRPLIYSLSCSPKFKLRSYKGHTLTQVISKTGMRHV